ncbi:MAG: late competence protein ComER [Bacillus sp. (in: firmicutes)]
MKIGIIGSGNMGSILAEAFIQSNAVLESNLLIYTRTISKALALQNKYPKITVCDNLNSLIKDSLLIFACVKPGEMHALFYEMKPIVSPEQCVVSITSPISVEQMESVLPCQTARMIPSITNKVMAGVSLVTFGVSCTEEWRRIITELAEQISEVIEIDNSITRVSSDIVSCGPAFFSYLAQQFINGATTVTNIDTHSATVLTEKMLIGFGELLKSGQYTLPTLQEKVCVKGGITGEGIKVFDAQLGDMFENVFKATHAKFHDEIEKIEKQFQHKY